MSSKQVPSPEATGGAGVSFEMRVGAIALTRLLRGDRVVGLDTPPIRVRLQQRVASAVLDDIVIDAADPRGGLQVVECQVKRTMSIAAGDEDFIDVVGRVVGELKTDPVPIDGGRKRFCLATRPTPAIRQLDRVLRSARAHDTPAGFLQVLTTSAAREVRERLSVLRSVVAAALSDGVTDAEVDTATWRVARVLFVWPIDAEAESDDVRGALDRLTDLLRDGDAQMVFSELLAFAQELAQHAGSTDLAMLRTRLETKGIALDDTPSRRAAFERLAANSQSLLDPGAAELGRRLHLPRLSLRRAVRSAIEEHDIVVLKGRAGVGKSIAARLVGNDLASGGAEVIVVDVSGRRGPLALLEQELGGSLADALSGAPIGGQRLLIIDSAEQALTDGGQLLTGLLAAVPVEKGSAPPWRVLLTSRDEAASAVTRIVTDRTGSPPGVVSVEELEDGEVDLIIEAFPRLAPVQRNARARSLLLRRPYLVELLVRAVETQELPNDIAGEEDVLAIVNDRLIRRDQGGLPGRGAPYARADIFLQLGEAVVDNALPVRLDGTDPEARAGLSSDDIIAELRSSWRFAHDVMADYAAATRLLVSDGSARLRSATTPRRLLRAARLRLQREFADAVVAGTFLEVWHVANSDAEELVALDGPRWRDVPWEALLHLGRTREALDELRPELLGDDGAQLLRLIDVAHRLARRTNTREADDLTLLDTTLTGPVVDLLATNASAIPLNATVASGRLVHDHLYAAAHRDSDAELHHQTDLADAVVHWAQDDEWGPRFEYAVGALALNAANLESRHEAFLVAHAKERPDGVAEAVEAPVTSQQLAATRPDLLLRLAGLYYLGRTLPMTGEAEESGKKPGRHAFGFDDEEGIRDHSLEHRSHLGMWPLGNNQSNPALGPFASLLNASAAEGLRLVGEIVDEATAARTELEGRARPRAQ